MRNFLSILFLTIFAAFGSLNAQNIDVPFDENTDNLIRLGKKYYQENNFLDAALTFDLALQRPFNQQTTTAMYMAGVSFYKLGEKEKAQDRLKDLLAKYPKTQYRPEVEYHLAMIKAESDSRNDQELGLDQLFDLLEKTDDRNLQTDVENTIRYYLYEYFDQNFVELYQLFVDRENKPICQDALFYKMDKENRGFDLLAGLNKWESDGNELTPYMESLRSKYSSGKTLSANRVNIAVFLSMHLEKTDTARQVPGASARGFELYQGMQMALDSLANAQDKRFNIRIFDTKGDTGVVARQLEELDEFQPDIIIGEIRTSVNMLIGQWAEQRDVIQLILRNPLSELIEDKRNIYLIHPSIEGHAISLANHLVYNLKKRKILVFSSSDFFSRRYAKTFLRAVDSTKMGVTVVEREVPEKFTEKDYKALLPYLRGLKTAGYDAIYIPLTNEEWAGFIISELNYYKVETQVFGGPHWRNFEAIDPELKSFYQLEYTHHFYERNDTLKGDQLKSMALKDFCYPPSDNIIMGYDVMAYLLNLLNDYNGTVPLTQMFANASLYKGIHQDIYFGQQHYNQAVNILKFENGKTEKVNDNSIFKDDGELEKSVPDGLRIDPGGR